MVWVFVFGGIALAGLVMVICYGVWLAHKAADVMGELAVLGQRGAELGGLLGQIQVSGPSRPTPGDFGSEDHSGRTVQAEVVD